MIKPGGMGYYSSLKNFPITKNTIIIDPKEGIQIKKRGNENGKKNKSAN